MKPHFKTSRLFSSLLHFYQVDGLNICITLHSIWLETDSKQHVISCYCEVKTRNENEEDALPSQLLQPSLKYCDKHLKLCRFVEVQLFWGCSLQLLYCSVLATEPNLANTVPVLSFKYFQTHFCCICHAPAMCFLYSIVYIKQRLKTVLSGLDDKAQNVMKIKNVISVDIKKYC